MARSGNGTAQRQWLYIMGNFPMLWIVKIGITGNPSARLRSVDKSAPGKDFYLFRVRIIWAYQIEQFVHALCFFLRVRFWGSGHTERFLFPAAIPAVVFGLAVFVLEKAAWLFLIYVLFQLASCTPYTPCIKPLTKMDACCRSRMMEAAKAKYRHEYNRLIGTGLEDRTAVDSANYLSIRWTGETLINMKADGWRSVCRCKYWE